MTARRRAADALRKMPGPEASAALVQALGDADLYVRVSAVKGLGRLDTDDVIPILVRALGDDDLHDLYVIQEAAKALERIGPRALVPILHAAPGIRAYWGRCFALDLLAAFRDRRALPVALLLMEDADLSVRIHAFKTAGVLGDPSALPKMMAGLRADDVHTRKAAAEGLGALADPAAADALLQALSDSDEGVVAEAAYALGRCGDARALRPVADLLAHTSATVQCRAADGLGALGDWNACPYLLERLVTDDSGTGAIVHVAEALRRLRCVGVADALVQVLVRPGAPNRAWAAMALGGSPEPYVKPALLQALQNADDDGGIAGLAAEALVFLGDDQVTPEIAGAARTARHRRHVLVVTYEWLIRWGLLEAELIELIEGLNWEFRRHLGVFLGCGNPRLAAAAERVARKYRIHPTPLTSIQWASRRA